MKRFDERRIDLNNAYKRLEEALCEEPTELAIDGTLHRFEFTFELAWKTIKDYLEYNGIVDNTGSPREVLKSAFKQGLIEDGDAWIDMMLARNSLSHQYDKNVSREIYEKIKTKYIFLLKNILEKL